MKFFTILTSLGPTVMLPVIITLFGLLFRLGLGKAFRAGVTIGIGFAGINIVIGYFWGAIAPVAEALANNAGFELTVIDLGWPAASAVAWGSSIAPLLALALLVINFLMLILNWTKTLNVDIWNFWGVMLLGQIVYYRTGSMLSAIITCSVVMIFCLIMADKTQKLMYDYFQIPGVSIPHVFTQSAGLIAFPINWLLDRIPVINKINWSPGNLQKRFGVMGEPMMIGLVIGAALAVMAKMPYQTVLLTAMGLAVSMVLLPKMVSILMEGLVPIAEAAGEFMTSRFSDREVHIGMDSAIMLGDPANLTTAVLLIPVSLVIAAVLPGCKTLPLADLPAIVYMTVVGVAITKGNLFRSLIIGATTLCAVLWTATAMSPFVTALARQIGFAIPEGTAAITSFVSGSYWFPYLIQEAITKITMLF
ncbi:MAG: PTS galactitol transporter subunit IIC [Clostridia bacterium]|jgi:PTS system galactitol-specific IIC component|nr:PTS galactitol transporter subunit IIC [Clostridia bacterium]